MNRRKAVLGILISIVTGSKRNILFAPSEPKSIFGYTKNEEFEDVLPLEKWPGTPLDNEGNFINHEFPMVNNFYDVLKWKLGSNPFKNEKETEDYSYPVNNQSNFLSIDQDIIVWLGHATFYIQVNGIRILVDPIFDAPITMKRLTKFPNDPSDFKGIDYVLISHDHRDHMDKSSIKLLSKQNPDIKWLTGLNMKDLLGAWTGSNRIYEAGWFQRYPLNEKHLSISFVPSRHWSKREFTKSNERLWGGFVIESGGKKIYFGGDSGKGSHFSAVSDAFGGIDYFLVGIGAFEPRWFMAQNHMSPLDAAEIITEIRPKNTFVMHHSTFDLSDEPLGEPIRQFGEIYFNDGLPTHWIKEPIGTPIILNDV